MKTTDADFVAAKKGNTLAFKKLYAQYQPIVFKYQRKYTLRLLDDDDWQQEGRIIFYKSLTTYEPKRGLTFGCFFRMNFERHIYSLLRKQGAEKRKTEMVTDSLEEIVEKTGQPSVVNETLGQTTSYQYVVLRDVLAGFEKDLSPFECCVFREILAANAISKIGQDLKCSDAQVKNAVDRIKRKFKNTIQ